MQSTGSPGDTPRSAIEDAFAIEISDSAAERIVTVSDLVAFIRGNEPAARAEA